MTGQTFRRSLWPQILIVAAILITVAVLARIGAPEKWQPPAPAQTHPNTQN